MTLPDWNTHNTFLTDNTRTFGTTPELNVEGTYRFYASAHPDHVERLKIAVDVSYILPFLCQLINAQLLLILLLVPRRSLQDNGMDDSALIQCKSRSHVSCPMANSKSDLSQLRDNYFGTFTHFVTLEEYRHRHERNLQGDPLELKFRPGSVSGFVILSF